MWANKKHASPHLDLARKLWILYAALILSLTLTRFYVHPHLHTHYTRELTGAWQLSVQFFHALDGACVQTPGSPVISQTGPRCVHLNRE